MSQGWFALLLLLPLAAGAVCASLRDPRRAGIASLIGSLVYGTAWVSVSLQPGLRGTAGPFMLDALGAVAVCLVSLVGVIASAFSVGYMEREVAAGHTSARALRAYYGMYHAFVAAMFASLVAASMGMTWVTIEATTLVSSLLVGFYGRRHSLEAAWKYLVVCSLGIAFALFGLVLVHYAAVSAGAPDASALSWRALLGSSHSLNPDVARLAFVFLLVGFGTKAGFAPMHTWLPDAHSQAPSPVSALLSAVLLNCAMVAVVRSSAVVAGASGPTFVGELLVAFGMLSLAVAAPLMLVQGDIKRLLAYSSVEHMGVIALGFGVSFLGFGRVAALGAGSSARASLAAAEAAGQAAMAHMVYHSLAKVVLFLVAGAVIQRSTSKRMARTRALLAAEPALGLLLLAGLMAIAGMPPFGPFLSELGIAAAAFASGSVLAKVAASAMLLFLAVAFAALMFHGGQMLFASPASRLREARGSGMWRDRLGLAALAIPLVLLAWAGVHAPAAFRHLMAAAAATVRP